MKRLIELCLTATLLFSPYTSANGENKKELEKRVDLFRDIPGEKIEIVGNACPMPITSSLSSCVIDYSSFQFYLLTTNDQKDIYVKGITEKDSKEITTLTSKINAGKCQIRVKILDVPVAYTNDKKYTIHPSMIKIESK